ncbi:MAG: chromate transporter [Ruminococcaceae bacterium]|nr:chromate transporter [Oscillospiraceae bacterium]
MIFLKLFLTFFKIGLFTFGGGYAMLPLMRQEVLANNWLTESEIINFIAVSESSPGPFAINMATYIGSETGGFLGSVCATLGVVLPSFIVILLVAKFFMTFKDNKWVKAVMSGLKPAVVGLISAAIISVAIEVFFPNKISLGVFSTFAFWVSAVIFSIVMFLQRKKVHPIILIITSAVLGIVAGYLNEILNL